MAFTNTRFVGWMRRHMFEAQAECLEARILVLEAENRGLSYAVSGHESRVSGHVLMIPQAHLSGLSRL